MFLSALTKKQKRAYLDLAYSLISTDGVLSEEEILMVEQYQQEMSLEVPLAELSNNADTAISLFSNSSNIVKKQVLFELTGLAYADHDYAECEQVFLEKICTVWELDLSTLQQCRSYVKELLELYGEIGRFITS